MGRPRETLAGRLAALGFAETASALRILTEELGLDVDGADADLVTELAGAADPDQALTRLAAVLTERGGPRQVPGSGSDEDLLAALRTDHRLRSRLIAVLGTSAALADHLRRHREDWRLLASGDADLAPTAAQVTEELLAATAGVGATDAGRWVPPGPGRARPTRCGPATGAGC